MTHRVSPRTWLGGLGALATAGTLAGVAAIPGAVAGAVVVLTWLLVADVVALAVATVAVGALLSVDAFVVLDPAMVESVQTIERATTLTGLGVVELVSVGAVAVALVPLLLGSTASPDRPVTVAVVTLVFTAALAAVATAPLLAGGTVLSGAATLGLVVAAVAYGLHRYGMLAAGVLQRG